MNEKTKQRLESEITVPAPTQPVDKLRLAEAPAAEAPVLCSSAGCSLCRCLTCSCFADDE